MWQQRKVKKQQTCPVRSVYRLCTVVAETFGGLPLVPTSSSSAPHCLGLSFFGARRSAASASQSLSFSLSSGTAWFVPHSYPSLLLPSVCRCSLNEEGCIIKGIGRIHCSVKVEVETKRLMPQHHAEGIGQRREHKGSVTRQGTH